MFAKRARRAFSTLVACVVVTIATSVPASAMGDLPIPDKGAIDFSALGGLSQLFGNGITLVATIGISLVAIFFVISWVRYARATTAHDKQLQMFNIAGSAVAFIIIGAITDVFEIMGDVGSSLF